MFNRGVGTHGFARSACEQINDDLAGLDVQGLHRDAVAQEDGRQCLVGAVLVQHRSQVGESAAAAGVDHQRHSRVLGAIGIDIPENLCRTQLDVGHGG